MKKNIDRASLAEQLIILNGKPFSFKGREYLIPVYNTFRPVVLKAARQSEKSTTIANIMLLTGIMKPFFNSLYVSYTQKQVSYFSNLRFTPLLTFSPIIYNKFYKRSDLIKRVTDKTLTNGSAFFFRAMFSHHAAESIRGLSADLVAFDEVQSLDPRGIFIVEETLSHSKFKFRLYAGTAKSTANEIERLWNMSNRVEYFIRCEACNRWIYQDDRIIGAKHYICSHCGKQIYPRNGKLFVTGDPDAKYFGLRLTQIMVPWTSFEEIKDKYERMPPHLFYNEVLALPYDYAEKPVSIAQLEACCSDRGFLSPVEGFESEDLVAGIDWGMTRSNTEIVVGRKRGGKYIVYYVAKLKSPDPLLQIEQLVSILNKYRVKLVVADFGFGHGKVEQLQEYLKGKAAVLSCMYIASPIRDARLKDQGRLVEVNRTWSLSQVFKLIREQRYDFPNPKIMTPFFEEIMNVSVEMSSSKKGESSILYVHDAEHPDDFLHALNYFTIAAEIFEKSFMRGMI